MGRVLKTLRRLRHPRIVAALVAFGLLSLPPLLDVAGWWALAGIAAGAVLLALSKLSEFCRSLAEVVGAIAVPWLCLVGFNELWHLVLGSHLRPSLEFGLVIAGIVFALAAGAYLVVWRERKWAIPFVAIVLAAANVVGLPLLLTAPESESNVAAPQPVVSQLDIVLVVPPARAGSRGLPRFEGPSGQSGFDARYSVARAGSKRIEWLLLDSADAAAARNAALGEGPALPGAPTLRPGADHIVVLDPDGTPPVRPEGEPLASLKGTRGEVSRWLKLPARIAPDASVAVLLQTVDKDRLNRWARRVEPRGGAVASVQQLGASTITDAALTLAVQAPGNSEELSLAIRFRPVLLFDEHAKLDTPLDIDAFFASGRVDLCHDDQISGSRCAPVLRASDLINGPTHLRIRRPGATSEEPASSIYVHPSEVKLSGRHLLLLDYWWYLDDNPANVGKGTSCGIGLALPGKTCFDHQSDWEGMTVVVDRNDGDPTPVAVQYAQHADVVRYGFALLGDYWRARQAHDRPWMDPRLQRNLTSIADLADRPLAFVARGTHATYRGICSRDCGQVAVDLKENSHDGLRAWPANDTAECIATRCVRLLPTRHGGRDAALWNAYDGVWGDRRCILRGAYCTAERSPGSPATQPRYKNPLHVSGYVDANRRFHACGGERAPCPPLPLPSQPENP